MKFNDIKTETLNLRVSPTFKRALKEAADNEQRSMVNMLEVLLSDYCDSKGIVSKGKKSTPQSSSYKRASAGDKAPAGVIA